MQKFQNPTFRRLSWRKLLYGAIGMVLLLLVAGYTFEEAASARQPRLAAPGAMVDAGGYRMHIDCQGTARPGSPTVILEAGAGGWSVVWNKVQPAVAGFARVCAYDRTGFGWSEPDPYNRPRTVQQSATDLDALLKGAQIPPPYLLVGHSLGGLIVRAYAGAHPDAVAGLVLVDATHEAGAPQMGAINSLFAAQQRLNALIIRFGVARSLLYLRGQEAYLDSALGGPESQRAALQGYLNPLHSALMANELASLADSARQMSAQPRSLGAVPLYVLVAHETGAQVELPGFALQQDLASLSTQSKLEIVEDSRHHIQLDQPQAVISAIQEILEGL